jgi:hypothetical protein
MNPQGWGKITEPATIQLPVVPNPVFSKYRAYLGEELFQEFAEYTKELSGSTFWFERMMYFTDKNVIEWLVNKVKNVNPTD